MGLRVQGGSDTFFTCWPHSVEQNQANSPAPTACQNSMQPLRHCNARAWILGAPGPKMTTPGWPQGHKMKSTAWKHPKPGRNLHLVLLRAKNKSQPLARRNTSKIAIPRLPDPPPTQTPASQNKAWASSRKNGRDRKLKLGMDDRNHAFPKAYAL